jgi:MFS family permease
MKYGITYFGFIWHAALLAITATFIEINTVLPSMIIEIGGNNFHIGLLTTIMIGVPLISQLLFAGFLHSRPKKKPYLILGINLRVIALTLIALTIIKIDSFSFATALILIYSELLLFTLSGAFAGVSYVSIIGKSLEPEARKSLFLNKQIISSSGILVSAFIARAVLKKINYPDNYFILYISAAGALLLASGGFYILKEKKEEKPEHDPSLMETLASIPERIKNNSNLFNYIIISNLVSIGIFLLPFYVSFAKEKFSLESSLVGNLLLVQISGMIISSFLWKSFVKRHGFKGLLYLTSVLGIILPLAAFTFGTYLPLWAYMGVFFLSGSMVSAQRITAEAVLVEISTDENRALYSGIIGTFNLTVAILPLITGIIISKTGFLPIFISASVLAALGIRFISRLNCPADSN